MSKLTVAFDVVEKLLSVPGARVKNKLEKADQTRETDEFRFIFKGASDPRTHDFGNLLETLGIKPESSRPHIPRSLAMAMTRPEIIRGDLDSRARAALYSFGETQAFSEPMYAAKISEGGLKLLTEAAEQFMARQQLVSGLNADGNPVYRIPRPTTGTQDEIEAMGYRITTACRILKLEHTFGYSNKTNGTAIKFDDPETVKKLHIIRAEDEIKNGGTHLNPSERRTRDYKLDVNP